MSLILVDYLVTVVVYVLLIWIFVKTMQGITIYAITVMQILRDFLPLTKVCVII